MAFREVVEDPLGRDVLDHENDGSEQRPISIARREASTRFVIRVYSVVRAIERDLAMERKKKKKTGAKKSRAIAT